MIDLDEEKWCSIKIQYGDDSLITLYRRDVEKIQEDAKELKEKLGKVKTVITAINKTVKLVDKLSS